MKLDLKDQNYCATVIRVHALIPMKGLDNLVGISAFGYTALVSKETQVGQLGVLFTTETQLSEEFARKNNLFRHENLNEDKTVSGYLEDSRRVKCVKIRSNISSALFMPISSLSYLVDTNLLKEGDCFNSIDEVEVCRKYVIRQHVSTGPKTAKNRELRKSRIDSRLMPEHVSTSHWLKCEESIDDDTYLIKTVKLHGSSFRIANQLCDRKLSRWEKWLKWFGFKVQEQEYDYFAASRRVIKNG